MAGTPVAAKRHPRRGKKLRRIQHPEAGTVALRKLQENLDWWLKGRERADPTLLALMNAALSFQLEMPWQAAALLVMLRVNSVRGRLDPVFAAVDHLVEKQGPAFVLESLCLAESLEVASDSRAFWLEWSYGHVTPLSSQLGGWQRLREHLARASDEVYREVVELAEVWRGRGELPLRCSLSYLCSDQAEWAAADLAECLQEPAGFPPYGWRLLATLRQTRLIEDLLRRYGQHCPDEFMWCLHEGLGQDARGCYALLRDRWGMRALKGLNAAEALLGPSTSLSAAT